MPDFGDNVQKLRRLAVPVGMHYRLSILKLELGYPTLAAVIAALEAEALAGGGSLGRRMAELGNGGLGRAGGCAPAPHGTPPATPSETENSR